MIDLKARPFYLSDEDIAWVEKTRDAMTVEEKAGQLFCVLFKEVKQEEFDYVFGLMQPGGCMYRVVPTETAVAGTQTLYRRCKVPPLIAANLEKGGNGIVTEGTLVGSPMEIAATDDEGMAAKMAHACAAEALAVGANWAFAPIIDIDSNFRNPITNTRTFGSDPERVRRMGRAYVEEVQRMGLAASIKHFPGDGQDERDQHDRQQTREVQPAVREEARLEQRAVGAHVERLHDLRQRERHERQRLAAGEVAGRLPADPERRKGQNAEHQTLQDDADAEPVREDAFVLRLRFLPHHARLDLFHAERDRRQGVRDQIDPQQLHREQRRAVPEQHGGKDRDDFADVCAEQEADHLADVRIDAVPLVADLVHMLFLLYWAVLSGVSRLPEIPLRAFLNWKVKKIAVKVTAMKSATGSAI